MPLDGVSRIAKAIEVAPIAHYHMGGIEVNESMETCVKGLFAAGECVGGANGANRLSGNAIPEAFVLFSGVTGHSLCSIEDPKRDNSDLCTASALE